MITMDIPHLDLWEKYILTHARCQPEDVQLDIPTELAFAMGLTDSNNVSTMTSVNYTDYWKAIFSQGHVSNLILLYAMAGKKYDNVRYDLTLCHLDYIVKYEKSVFKEWEDACWISDLFKGKISMQQVFPLMIKWLQKEIPEEVFIRYQQMLPLFLYLGDYTKLPDSRLELRTCMYGLVGGTFTIAGNSWKDVYYDISKSRHVFKVMVKYADSMFARDSRKRKKRSWLSMFSFWKNRVDDSIYQKVGNWLAFCAYITLLSKYQRYALNAEGFKDAKSFIGTEVSRQFLKIREQIG